MKLRTQMIAHPLITAILVLAFVAVASAAVPVFKATEAPQFCPSCHEMQPYYDAWETGAHKGVACVDCHVDGGTVNHLKHKVVAAKEVWVHFSGDPRFPQGAALVPDSRCLSCHETIMQSSGPKFSHKEHAKAGACVDCHSESGHQVTTAALAEAGVLKPGAEASTAMVAQAALRSDAAGVPTHTTVTCSKCHDLAKVACSECHEPAHDARGECATCHRSGTAWEFSHPSATDCVTCHAAPAKHFGADCASCHKPGTPFKGTAYSHVSGDCATCHAAPAAHNGKVSCATCHKKRGTSWAASHPGSRACASCHKAPASHFGSSCASCHKPLVSWRKATFSHPRTEEHSYRSFACAKCHPSGYSSASCTCHGGKPPKDD